MKSKLAFLLLKLQHRELKDPLAFPEQLQGECNAWEHMHESLEGCSVGHSSFMVYKGQ